MDEFKPSVRSGLVNLIFSTYENDPRAVCDALVEMGILKAGADRIRYVHCIGRAFFWCNYVCLCSFSGRNRAAMITPLFCPVRAAAKIQPPKICRARGNESYDFATPRNAVIVDTAHIFFLRRAQYMSTLPLPTQRGSLDGRGCTSVSDVSRSCKLITVLAQQHSISNTRHAYTRACSNIKASTVSLFIGCCDTCSSYSVEKIARSFLTEFTNTLNQGQDGQWTSELSKVGT